MRITRKTMVALAATGALGLASVPVLAQETTTDDTPVREMDRDECHDELAAALAEELGLETEEVATALDGVMEEQHETRRAQVQDRRQERFDAAVENGELTQEQADELAEQWQQRAGDGELGFGPQGRRGGPDGPGGPGGHGRHGGQGAGGGFGLGLGR